MHAYDNYLDTKQMERVEGDLGTYENKKEGDMGTHKGIMSDKLSDDTQSYNTFIQFGT